MKQDFPQDREAQGDKSASAGTLGLDPSVTQPVSAGAGLPIQISAQHAYLHVTHWKAGSQWIKGILAELFGPSVVPQQFSVRHVWGEPVQPGRVYPAVYLTKPQFDALELPPNFYAFVLIRDLRDTLVSAYFSLRNSHPAATPELAFHRRFLERMSAEEGMLHLLQTWLGRAAHVQRTWLAAGVPFFRLEDCTGDTPRMLRRIFAECWGLEVDLPLLEQVASRHSFASLSGGRDPGQEDLHSHYRKGVPGDWRHHFTPPIGDAFERLYNDVLFQAGYETEAGWSQRPFSTDDPKPLAGCHALSN